MNDALGMPQSALVVGGSSEIAGACLRRLVARRTRKVALAGRPGARMDEAAAGARNGGATQVAILPWEAGSLDGHSSMVEAAVDALGEIDLALIAVGQLGDQMADERDARATAAMLAVNFVSPAAVGAALGEVVRRQGQGTIAVLSSVAAERPRRSNFVYGGAKSGLDAYYRGLGYSLTESGGRVLVIRPGFVHTRMTEGMKVPPLSTTPDAVADVLIRSLEKDLGLSWVPGALRVPAVLLRHLPEPLWRRLSSRF